MDYKNLKPKQSQKHSERAHVCAKFRNFPLRINKALGIFRKRVTTSCNKKNKNNRRSA